MVYITSDLFGPAASYDRFRDACSTCYSNMTTSPQTAGLGKRKRSGEEALEQTPSPVQRLNHEPAYANSAIHARSPLSCTSSAYHQHNTPHFESNSNLPFAVYTARASERRPAKQTKRIIPKTTLIKSTSHLMDIEPESKPPPVSDLRSCHACNLAPRRKKDLENYLDCRRCDGRTCYICARQCVGGCAKAVCKKCIVEVGQEGEAWCLDCYARDINS